MAGVLVQIIREIGRRAMGLVPAAAIVLGWLAGTAGAQQRYYPLNQQTPPGVYGEWSGWQRPGLPPHLQPVRVQLPGDEGAVTFYSDAQSQPISGKSPVQAAIALGATYRLKLSDLPDYPGLELYPTIELVDVLHPPQGQADKFPIPVVLTEEDIRLANEGRLVTKVVYLEPAREANPLTLGETAPDLTVRPSDNVIEEADRRGRPMLILRVGSRTPAAGETAFFGAGAPLSPKAVRP